MDKKPTIIKEFPGQAVEEYRKAHDGRLPSEDPRLPNADGCPVCFNRLDAATCATEEDARPKPGDLTVCFYCTTFLKFDAELRHVALAPGEFQHLSEIERRTLVRARTLIRARSSTSEGSR